MNEENNKNDFFERLNDWNRNEYGIICNTLSYFVLIGFWSLYFFGNKIMLVSKNVRSWFNSYYHHLFIQIIIIIDIFSSDRKKIIFSWKKFGILVVFYTTYCGLIGLEKYIFGRNAYYFMEGKSLIFLIFCFIFSSLCLYISYLIHINLVEFKINKLNDNNEENNSCNKIFSSFNNENCIKFIEEGKL